MIDRPHHQRLTFTFLWVGSLLAPPVAWAQDERPADNPIAAQIADAAAKVHDGKLLDAVEHFQRIIDTSGDELVPVGRHHQARTRLVVQGHLARLPADGLKLYRQRVDGQAAKRLEEAKKSRDDAAFKRLLDDMFAATATEEAILELARRSFERGEFDAAEHYWRMLLPPVEDDNRLLRFPDPKTDVAAIKARLLMVQLFRGERDQVRDELKAFKEKHADAAGLLAGKNGNYIDTLTDLLNNPAKTALPRPSDESGWNTFAGSAARTGTLRTRLPYFWPDVPAWKSPLPLVRFEKLTSPPIDHPRSLAFHPVISKDRAYVADGARLFAVDLMTGKITRAAWPKGGEETRIPTQEDARFTLTEHGGILYARFGPTALASREGADSASFIVAFGKRKGDTEERDPLWRLEPPAGGDDTTHFEGAPIVHRDRLYVGLWRQSAGDADAGVACYRIDDPKKAPELAWQRIVGKAGSEPNGETRYRHKLVTISGPNVIYCTDGGTVVALNAADGKPAWEYRYPRNERPTMPRYRDLSPPLADGGRIYAAPADTDRLLCLDAYTGQLIWEHEGVEVIHLLGVARGRLIATFAGQVKGIRGLNLRTGADSGENGWTIHDDGGEMTFGRGLVTEEAVVWPTKHGLHFIDPADGSPLRSPIRGSFGNLCYADGVLLVTTPTEVWGYLSEAKQLDQRRKAIEEQPEKPKLRVALTQSLIDAGLYAEAEKEAAKAGEGKERLLWLMAEKIIREGDKQEAKRLYEVLAKGDGSFAAAGAVRLAEMCEEKEKVREAWRAVFSKRATVRDEHGCPWPAWTFAEVHSPELLVMRASPPEDDFVGYMDQDGAAMGFRGLVRAESIARDNQPRPVPNPYVLNEGTNHIACCSSDDGKLCWSMKYDASGPILSALTRLAAPAASGIDGPTALSAVNCVDLGATFIYDDRMLVTVKPRGGYGRVRLDIHKTAHLHPNFASSGDIAQTSGGRMLVWPTINHAPLAWPCSTKPWPERPVSLTNERFLIPDDASVFIFDTKAGKEFARYKIPGVESLSGELPRFRMHQGDPLLVIDRNHGVELDRLKIDGLKRSWARDAIFAGRSLDDVAFSGDRFFFAADGMLAGHSWKDGEQEWEMPLPDAPHTKWKLSIAPQGLLVHPAEAIILRPDFDVIDEFQRSSRSFDGLLRAASKSYDVWTARELPILVIDPADGRLIQRLNFPALGPAAGVAVTPKGVVVVTGKGNWTLSAKP